MFCTYSARADKDLGRLPPEVKQRVIDKLGYLCANDLLIVNSKAMTGNFNGFFRVRIGNYRVIFDITDNNCAAVIRIGHRSDIYH